MNRQLAQGRRKNSFKTLTLSALSPVYKSLRSIVRTSLLLKAQIEVLYCTFFSLLMGGLEIPTPLGSGSSHSATSKSDGWPRFRLEQRELEHTPFGYVVQCRLELVVTDTKVFIRSCMSPGYNHTYSDKSKCQDKSPRAGADKEIFYYV